MDPSSGGVGLSTVKRNVRVTSWMVRSPSTDNSPSRTNADALGFEMQLGKFSHVKEIGALKVRIPLVIASVDGGSFD